MRRAPAPYMMGRGAFRFNRNDGEMTQSGEDERAVKRRIRAAGERAKAEAEARRRTRATPTVGGKEPELGGREGPDPVRYGDWEVNGIASDF